MKLVRTTYWLGAIIDLLAGLQLLFPESTRIIGFEGLKAQGNLGLPAVTAAVLMFGFTAILIWAQLKPVRRRGILFITLAVIITLATVNVVSGLRGLLPWNKLIGPLVIQGTLVMLFTLSSIITSRAAATRNLPK